MSLYVNKCQIVAISYDSIWYILHNIHSGWKPGKRHLINFADEVIGSRSLRDSPKHTTMWLGWDRTQNFPLCPLPLPAIILSSCGITCLAYSTNLPPFQEQTLNIFKLNKFHRYLELALSFSGCISMAQKRDLHYPTDKFILNQLSLIFFNAHPISKNFLAGTLIYI